MIGKHIGRWLIERELGHGGMGHVYLGIEADPKPDREPKQAAVKVMYTQLAQQQGFVQRFAREVEAISRLRHPNIVQFWEAGEIEDTYFYAMEFVDGPTFDELLEEKDKLPWDDVLSYALQICPALKHAHDHGIIHRDIKPSNLLLSKDGKVKLTDFSIAKVFANVGLTATDAIIGTAEFMSPEQAAGKPVTRKSDLYSLGVLLYTLITGRTPFEAENTAEMIHKHRYARFDEPIKYVTDLPHEFNDIICQLMEKDPDKRPNDAQVVGRTLERLRQKLSRRGHHTTDDVRKGATRMEGEASVEEPDHMPGPATMMSGLVRAELEALNRPGPISRIVNKPWVLIPLFGLVVGAIVWGLWPKSQDQLIADTRAAIAQADLDLAEKKLSKLSGKTLSDEQTTQVAELRAELDKLVSEREARHNARKSGESFKPSVSEAERFYREGMQEFQNGNVDKAIAKWKNVLDAFIGIKSQAEWVLLAKTALSEAERQHSDLSLVDEAIKLAAKDGRPHGERRLRALRELYRTRTDARAEEARIRIDTALDRMNQATIAPVKSP